MWLSDLTGIFTALGALVAAGAAIRLNFYARQQAQEMLEARYDQSHPLVVPLSEPPMQRAGEGPREDFFAHAAPDRPSFRNIGTGPALNVWAVIYGPRPTVPSQVLPPMRSVIVEVPMAAGEERGGDGAVGRISLDGDTTLDDDQEHTLYAPVEPTPWVMPCCATPCGSWPATRSRTTTSSVTGT